MSDICIVFRQNSFIPEIPCIFQENKAIIGLYRFWKGGFSAMSNNQNNNQNRNQNNNQNQNQNNQNQNNNQNNQNKR